MIFCFYSKSVYDTDMCITLYIIIVQVYLDLAQTNPKLMIL